jgi:hypothetical protein
MGAELFHEHAITLHSQGGLFSISVQNLYEKSATDLTHAVSRYLLRPVPLRNS